MGKHSRVRSRWTGRSVGTMSAVAVVGTAALFAGPAAMAAGAQAGDSGPDLVPGTPCTATAKACVDLVGGHAWLISDGRVTRGPVPIKPGAPDQPTPVGTFVAQWKDPHHISDAPNHAEMPWSVFFADGGVAFHQGSLERFSAGCVHLGPDDAKAFYDYLQVGDQVQVH
jgi:Uncharacterized protein conserved in bacteria